MAGKEEERAGYVFEEGDSVRLCESDPSFTVQFVVPFPALFQSLSSDVTYDSTGEERVDANFP